MDKLDLRKSLMFAAIIFLGSVCAVRAQQQVPVSCTAPLTQEQLTRLLTSGVADVRVQAFVSQCGVDFEPTAEIDKRLRGAGASDTLLGISHRLSPKALRARQLRGSIEYAISSESWTEAEEKLMELKALAPEDDEMRHLVAAINEHKRVEQEKQAEEGERKHREEVRLSELCRKLGIELSAAPALKPNLTLDQARQQLVSLQAQVADIEARLKAAYPSLEAVPKDTFETTAEYEARLARIAVERAQLEQAYSRDLDALTRAKKAQITDLLSRQYRKPESKITLTKYDADKQQLIAIVGNGNYWFVVPPQKARILYTHQQSLEAKARFLQAEHDHLLVPTEVSLIDSQTQEEVKSAGRFSLTARGASLGSGTEKSV